MTRKIDAKIVAVKIKRAIEEFREGAQDHLDMLQAEQDEAERSKNADEGVEPEYSSEDEMNRTQQIIDELDKIVLALEEQIIPLLGSV